MRARKTIAIRFPRRPKAFRLAPGPGATTVPSKPASAEAHVEAALRARAEAQERELALLVSLTGALRRETERLAKLRAEIARDLETRLVDIATVVCESVLGERIERGDYRVVNLLRPAFQALTAHGVKSAEISIRLHPADRVSLETAGDVAALGPGVSLVEDESVSRASCVIDTPVGSVVSDVNDVFREALFRLRESVARTHAERADAPGEAVS